MSLEFRPNQIYLLTELHLHVRCGELNKSDPRSLAFRNADPFGGAVFTALPGHIRPTNEEFQLAAATYLGVPWSKLANQPEKIYPNKHGHTKVDVYGFSLSNWKGVSRTPLHNSILSKLHHYMKQGGHVRREPGDVLLAHLDLPDDARRRRKQNSIIPGLLYSGDCESHHSQSTLLDVKTLGGRAKHYNPRRNRPTLKAITARAREVPDEYMDKAKEMDGGVEGGPLQQFLGGFKGIIGLGFGFYSEASESVHTLAQEMAENIVQSPSDNTVAFIDGSEEQIARTKDKIRKDIGLTCAFGWARLKILALFRLRTSWSEEQEQQNAVIRDEVEGEMAIGDGAELGLQVGGLGMGAPFGVPDRE